MYRNDLDLEYIFCHFLCYCKSMTNIVKYEIWYISYFNLIELQNQWFILPYSRWVVVASGFWKTRICLRLQTVTMGGVGGYKIRANVKPQLPSFSMVWTTWMGSTPLSLLNWVCQAQSLTMIVAPAHTFSACWTFQASDFTKIWI